MAEQEAVYLTKEGKKELEEKLLYLTTVKRAEVARNLQEARSFGDLSENAEYDAAKEEQGQVEGQIIELENKLSLAIIFEQGKSDIVVLGTKVTILNEEKKTEVEYTVVGTTEADPAVGKISNESPIGRAMLGKKKGDVVITKGPTGRVLQYKIISIN